MGVIGRVAPLTLEGNDSIDLSVARQGVDLVLYPHPDLGGEDEDWLVIRTTEVGTGVTMTSSQEGACIVEHRNALKTPSVSLDAQTTRELQDLGYLE